MMQMTKLRLKFIDARIEQTGAVSQNDIMEAFGVSYATATMDFVRYKAARPGVLKYDSAAGLYRYDTAGQTCQPVAN